MNTSQSAADPIAIPPPHEALDVTMNDGAIVRLRRHGRAGAPRIVLSHGNGLAIDAYVPFWGPLTERYDIVVFDCRNHGENPLHDAERHGWASIIADMETLSAAIADGFGPAPTIGAFHSLSSIAVLNHAIAHPERWDALVLFDPPSYPPNGHPLQPLQQNDMDTMERRALRRPEIYASPQEFADQLAARRMFSRWVPGTHELLARTTLRQHADGMWTLRLPREMEAKIFRTNTDATLWDRMKALPMPLKMIASDPACEDMSPSALTCRALHEERGWDYVMVPDTTHFLQIEQPEICRRHLIEFVDGCLR